MQQRLWSVVLPGIRGAVTLQSPELKQWFENHVDHDIHMLNCIENLEENDRLLDDQLRRFLWTVIDGTESQEHESYKVLLREAFAEYLLSTYLFPPRGEHASITLDSIADMFPLRQEDVEVAAYPARDQDPCIHVELRD